MKTVYLSCHHKTGTHFLHKLKRLLQKADPGTRYVMDPWSKEATVASTVASTTNDVVKIVHMVRHPYEIIVSGYLYHKTVCQEPWCIDPTCKTLADGVQYDFDGVSYQETLRSLPVEEGIDMEMEGRSYQTIRDMYAFVALPDCLHVEMEDLFEDLPGTVRRILAFLEVPVTAATAATFDLSSLGNHGKHVTNETGVPDRYKDMFSEENYDRFAALFPDLPWDMYRYRYL